MTKKETEDFNALQEQVKTLTEEKLAAEKLFNKQLEQEKEAAVKAEHEAANLRVQVGSLQEDLNLNDLKIIELEDKIAADANEALNIIAELQSQIETKKSDEGKGHTASIIAAGEETQTYQFLTGAFKLDTVNYFSADITDNHPILLQLVEMQAGIIKKI